MEEYSITPHDLRQIKAANTSHPNFLFFGERYFEILTDEVRGNISYIECQYIHHATNIMATFKVSPLVLP